MKQNYFLFVLVFISVNLFSQDLKNYYVVVKNNYSIEPSNNYVLSISSTQTTINLNDYQAGHYIVTLVCDGQIVDSKNLIKN